MNNLRHIRTIIYRLKRSFGCTIVIVKVAQATYNLKTGSITPSETKTTINYALVLPVKIAREAFISSGKPFDYGAVEDSSQRIMVIDRKDYTTEINLNDYVEFSGQRWNVKDVEAVEHDHHVLITVQSVKSQTS